MTHPTSSETTFNDEKLDALVEKLRDGDCCDTANCNCDTAADAITALRAQRAEAWADRAFAVSDGQRMLRKQDIITVCDTPDLCFESDDGVARCGPCAKKLAERDGITLNQYTVSNPAAMRLRRELAAANARADRAEQRVATLEAALAAQIEADAGLAERRYSRCERDNIGQCQLRKCAIGAVIRNQPHDRTALGRMLRAEREKALREAADLVQATAYTSNSDGRSLEPVSAGLVGMDMHHATIATAILAMIERQ